MSSLLGEFALKTTEDLGFKPLWSKALVPGFKEQIPFAKLTNVSIHQVKKFIALGSSTEVLIYKLQALREENYDALDKKTFDSNVISVLFAGKHLYVTLENNQIWYSDVNHFSWELLYSNDLQASIYDVKVFGDDVIILTNDHAVLAISGSAPNSLRVLDTVAKSVSLDSFEGQLTTLTLDGDINIYDQEYKLVLAISKPEITDPSDPITINRVSKRLAIVSYGESVSSGDTDIMYDLKSFVVNLETQEFAPSMDIAPPFSTVLRNPSYYTQTLYDITGDLHHLYLVGSSCASELSIISDSSVFTPDQDSNQAILPINPDTDNDTQPIGMAIDIVSEGTVFEPCSGVDSADNLPLVYVLTNLGELHCWALFHHSALTEGTFTIEPTRKHLLKYFESISDSQASFSGHPIKPFALGSEGQHNIRK